jgi:hypothetical protein
MKKWSLKRTIQCAKCPWKCSTNPFDIPDGYSVDKHKNLKNTISKEPSLDFGKVLNVMACHHSKPGREEHCIGWLNNQLGVGNNIQLRIQMLSCENASQFRVIGSQHDNFENTLPNSPTCQINENANNS